MLAAENKFDLQSLTQEWSNQLVQHGLRLNLKKTECMTSDRHEMGTINIKGEDLTRVCKYLGSTITVDGRLTEELDTRPQVAWMKRRTSTVVACDRRMKDNLKSKSYRTVIRPVTLYGCE
ncbi:uncharacterized protein LOC126214936 [Schistocerca nitens]|uniref:uncharacterized protein LOC126214936 n=1 Tax=Schistocerca nitens TaxID=7011 RepID=UPI002119408F|nr:uncharacterized protein LOC126214936 [Schistocerca nitens]